MGPKKFYKTQIIRTEKELKTKQKQRNLFTISKLICFILICICLYKYASEQTPPFLWSALLFIIFFLFLTVWDNKLYKRITFLKSFIQCNRTELNYLKGDYSDLPEGDEFIRQEHFYTWDLDIFGPSSLFREINRTVTPEGKQRLAANLENPVMEPGGIRKRQWAAEELSKEPEWCLHFLARGHMNPVGKTDRSVMLQWKNEKDYFRRSWQKPFIYMAHFALILSICIGLLTPYGWMWMIWIFLFQLGTVALYTASVNKVHGRLGTFLAAAGNYLYLAEQVKAYEPNGTALSEIKNELFGEYHSLKAFRHLKKLLDGFDSRANLLVEILLNGLYMRDLHLLIRTTRWKNNYLDNMDKWLEAITLTDVYISMALYRFNHPGFCVPDPSGAEIINTSGAVHPLLHGGNGVANDFTLESLHRFFIVTGANMAGKSTFLRTIGTNMVLALSGNVVCAEKFSFTPIRIFTSMRTTDNLARGASYFHAELLRLKMLVEAASGGTPYFIILDEMLKGTNSRDKQYGSLKFLDRLVSLPVCGLVATHDLALGKMASSRPENFFNICFEIAHGPQNEIIYDYKIRLGVSKNMNATFLMEKMGLITPGEP